jgi:ethanolamine utilization microcompartment shell protein EutS
VVGMIAFFGGALVLVGTIATLVRALNRRD